MAQDTPVTVRIPAALRRQLEARANHEDRSLSAQIVRDLRQALSSDLDDASGAGTFLGLLKGARVPSDGDLRAVRRRLWRRLAGSGSSA